MRDSSRRAVFAGAIRAQLGADNSQRFGMKDQREMPDVAQNLDARKCATTDAAHARRLNKGIIVAKNPDLVQRFVDASTIGWYHYLYGDNAKANAAIKKDNPDISDDQIAFSIGKMKEYGVADSGDTLKLGMGAMTDARMKDFFDILVKAGVVKADVDYKKAYTLQFVDKGVGLELHPK